MFLDDDDEFLNNKVEEQLKCLSGLDDTWGACYTKYIRKKENIIFSKCTENRQGDLLKEELMRNLWIGAGSNLMVRRSVIKEVGGFNEGFIRNQDVEFLIRILKKYKLAHVNIIGLIVNIEDEPHIKKDINVELLTSQFIETFQVDIDSFPEADQKDIYEMLYLQVFRYLLFKKRNLLKGLGLIFKNKVSLINVFSYLFYLLDRKIKKESRPYKIIRI
jgi:hypothetical protein